LLLPHVEISGVDPLIHRPVEHRVVDQGVDAPEPLHGLGREGHALGGVADVHGGPDDGTIVALIAKGLLGVVEVSRRACAEGYASRAFDGRVQRELDAEPRPDPRNHHDLAWK
jgi:hypothetical protein